MKLLDEVLSKMVKKNCTAKFNESIDVSFQYEFKTIKKKNLH